MLVMRFLGFAESVQSGSTLTLGFEWVELLHLLS